MSDNNHKPKAVISDLHSNLEAVRAVLVDIEKRGVKDIICLGDIVGYGPNPRECIDLAKGFRVTILGNHDEAALWSDQTESFNPVAKDAVDWTRRMLEDPKETFSNAKRWDFLGELQRQYQENSSLYVHGSPRRPVREYIFPEDIANRTKMEDVFSRIEHVCYIGHSHMPGVFTDDMTFRPPQEFFNVYEIDGKKTIINVGSIGQPRDGDSRACYVVVDGKRVEWIRVHYDVDETIRKIYTVRELDNFLGDRLTEGR
jgi:predicted phosphodiesterase